MLTEHKNYINSVGALHEAPEISVNAALYYLIVGATTMFSKKTCRLAMWSSAVVSVTAAPYLNVSS